MGDSLGVFVGTCFGVWGPELPESHVFYTIEDLLVAVVTATSVTTFD